MEAEVFTMLVAHEFFDAMPIDIFEVSLRYTVKTLTKKRTADGFRQVLVDSKDASKLTPTTGQQYRFVLSREPTAISTVLPATSRRFASLPTGTRVEIAADSWRTMRRVGELLAGPAGGAALVVDYGADRHSGSSFRARHLSQGDSTG